MRNLLFYYLVGTIGCGLISVRPRRLRQFIMVIAFPFLPLLLLCGHYTTITFRSGSSGVDCDGWAV